MSIEMLNISTWAHINKIRFKEEKSKVNFIIRRERRETKYIKNLSEQQDNKTSS